MIIKRVLTNNAVIVEVEGVEKIYCGKGIGFAKKKGDEIEKKRIERCFVLEVDSNNSNWNNLIRDIPFDYFKIIKSFLKVAEKELQTKFSDIFFLSLTDHIFGAVKRTNFPSSHLSNPFLYDLKTFYKKEFNVALKLNNFIKKIKPIQFSEAEIGFIALYFINGLVSDLKDDRLVNKVVEQILQIIRLSHQIEFNTATSVYNRLIVHLRYFAVRLTNNEHISSVVETQDFFNGIKQNYPLPYKTALKIKHFLTTEYGYEIEENELIYLTIHIFRILNYQNH